MSDQFTSKQILIGLPGAGKSTFLAALWQVVTSAEVPDALRLVTFDGDSAYIDRIHSQWLAGTQVERTILVSEGAEETVVMKLGRDGIIQAEVTIPDLSGELFNLQWLYREWSLTYDELSRSASGALVFLNPQTIMSGEMISTTIEEMIAKIEDAEEHFNEDFDEDIIEFDADKVPTQVKMIELLQYIAERPYLNHLKNIALIISAWDVACSRYKSPEAWLANQMPMLNQYLHTNNDRFSFSVYGLSCQGGELIDRNGSRTSKADELTRLIKPSERILVQEGSNTPHHDITSPIKWLIERVRETER